MNVVLNPNQGNFSLQWTETMTENHNQSKYRVMEPTPSGYMYKMFPYLRLSENWEGAVGIGIVRAKSQGVFC